ncbi:MAG: hypothetical protein WD772_01950, partial [Pseudohongiellaceae bacterium]
MRKLSGSAGQIPALVLATLLLMIAPALVIPPALARETTGESSTVIYPASYFTEYAPNSAQDMLNRIPGIGSGGGGGGGGPGGFGGGGFGGGGPGGFGGGGRRGLGDGGGGNTILING